MIDRYKLMLKSRYFEEKILELFDSGKLYGTTHLNIGQEASHTGLCLALDEKDWIVPTHRTHGFNVAKGSSISSMFSEMLGSVNGLCKGIGGSMHMSDKTTANLGASAVVGSGIGLATGLAFALKRQKQDNIAVAIFGDGATSRGILHECMNLAYVWDLPLLFFLENNGYGMSSSADEMISTTDISARAKGYSINAYKIDGNDLDLVTETIKNAREEILRTNKPVFVEVLTYRQCGHSKSDALAYRSEEEQAFWLSKDPILLYETKMALGADELNNIKNEVRKEVEDAFDLAYSKKDEVLSFDQMLDLVYAPSESSSYNESLSHEVTYKKAIYEALDELLTSEEKATFIGEDIGLYGGCFGLSGDLYKKHPTKVIETPISEEAFTTLAVGASALGERVIAEIMYGDFLTLASDAIINHGAKLRYMSGGQFISPLVLRCPIGAGTGHGSQHTQSLESMFLNVPGLKIVAPSDPFSAKALLKEAYKDNNPVLFLEHKGLYNEVGMVGDENSSMPIGMARVLQEGSKVTIVSYSRATVRCLKAIEGLDLDVELIDLCSIKPIDIDTIIKSVNKTGKLIVVEDINALGSVGSSVITSVLNKVELKKPYIHLAAKDCPIAFSKILEDSIFVQKSEILEAISLLSN